MLLPSGRAIPHYSAHITYSGEMAFFRAKYGAMMRQKAFGGSLLEIACFGGDTEILTCTGFKRIDSVISSDKVWDGVGWVLQGGALCRGNKVVTEVCGTRVTPDHLILCSERDSTPMWQSAGVLSPKELKSAIDLAASLLPDGFRVMKGAESAWTFLLNAIVALRKKLNAAATFDWRILAGALFAPEKYLLIATSHARGAIFAQTMPSGLNLLRLCTARSEDVITQSTKHGSITEPAALKYFGFGTATKARELFFGILRRFRGTTIRPWNWIVSKTTGATNRVIFVFQRVVRKWQTVERSTILKPSELVYDLLDCGPRNRFTIRTRTGHFLLVHNCQSMTRDLITAAEADIERELPDVVLLLDVYDSILALAPAGVAKERSAQMREIMKRPRSWTAGLPLGCEGYESDRVRK